MKGSSLMKYRFIGEDPFVCYIRSLPLLGGCLLKLMYQLTPTY
jgi:hypothetical protein